MQADFEKLINHHSIILLQTKTRQTISKFPYMVTTLNHAITFEDAHTQEYNYSFACTFYQFHGHHLAVGQEPLLTTLLNTNQQQVLNRYGFVGLTLPTDGYKLYAYNAKLKGSEAFINIHRAYLNREGILVCEVDSNALEYLPARLEPISTHNEYYSFSSEFAEVSDEHFLNILTKSKRKVGTYKKIDNKLFCFVDQSVFSWLCRLYVRSCL